MGGSLLPATTVGEPHRQPAAALSEIVRSRPRRYRMDILGPTGTVLAQIEEMTSGLMSKTFDAASQIAIEIPKAQFSAQFLTHPNMVRVYDFADRMLETFIIWTKKDADADGAQHRSVTGESLITLLGKEKLSESYDAVAFDNTKVRTIVKDLLALQEGPYEIRLGYISSSIGNLIRGLHVDQGKSILYGLLELHKTVGGYFWVDPRGYLKWSTRRGRDRGFEFEAGKNLRGIEVDEESHGIVTKLYYYGQSEGDDRLTLKDAGESEEFILAPSSIRNQPGIGLRVEAIFDSEVRDPDVLLDKAEKYLEAHQEAPINIVLDVIDLSMSSVYDYDPRLALDIGDTVTVIHDDVSGGALRTDVSFAEWNLQEPRNFSCKVGVLEKGLLVLLAELRKDVDKPPDIAEDVFFIDDVTDADDLDELGETDGIRSGAILYDREGGDWYGITLDPDPADPPGPRGRTPQSDITLKPLSLDATDVGDIAGTTITDRLGDTTERIAAEGDGGSSEDISRLDHVHQEMVTLHTQGDGSVFPYMGRVYPAANLAAINALEVDDLTFRDGDMAYAEDTDTPYIRENAGWQPFFRIKNYGSLPAIPSVPTLIVYDGIFWSSDSGMSRWSPLSDFSSESGAPA